MTDQELKQAINRASQELAQHRAHMRYIDRCTTITLVAMNIGLVALTCYLIYLL